MEFLLRVTGSHPMRLWDVLEDQEAVNLVIEGLGLANMFETWCPGPTELDA